MTWAMIANAAAFAAAYFGAGELSDYAVLEMAYFIMPVLALLAAWLLGRMVADGRARLLGSTVVLVAAIGALPRLSRPVGDRVSSSAFSPGAAAAADWLRASAPDATPLYVNTNSVSAFCLEIGRLKRTRTEETIDQFHDRAGPPGDYLR